VTNVSEYLKRVGETSRVLHLMANRCQEDAAAASAMPDGTPVRPVTAESDWNRFELVRDDLIGLFEMSRPADA
jgi:hypothetical protein